MPTPVILPKLGMTMVEGTITEWYQQSGDAVQTGDLLFAFETEKVNYEVQAEAEGTLHILVAATETVDAGAVDGMSAKQEYRMDGFTLEENSQTVQRLHDLLAAEGIGA